MEQGLLSKRADDAGLLEADVVGLFHSLFSETLNILESRFPHVKGSGSQNEEEFKAMRATFLRRGNDCLRKLPVALSSYCVVKTMDVVTERIEVNTPFMRKKQ